MSDETGRPGIPGLRNKNLTRRGVIGGAVGAGLATLVSVSPASASATTLQEQRFAMALRVTRAMAQFPIEFPAIHEMAPALARASAPRLTSTVRKLKAGNLARANAAADSLLADGMLSKPLPNLVARLGERSGDGSLAALAAVSVATLAPVNDPNDTQGSAQTWLGTLGRMHDQGTLTDAVNRRGIR
ncbi:MAG TPA: hypothetical protein VFB06_05790 [Streptosporangiaceae bacterium]|nr:hypothetical protein [Streptosporangiaceae bacterium]